MAKVKINRDNFRRLRTSPEALALVADRAEAVAEACNAQSSWGGYEARSSASGNRARAQVWTIEREAVVDNARNQRLIRNIGAT
jgi:hypothetical protein